MPFGGKYSIYREVLRHADPEVIDWFLRFINRWFPEETIDLIVLFGNRGGGEGLTDKRKPRQHRFMVVVRDEAPEHSLTGNSEWRAMVDEMMSAASRSDTPYVDILVCRRTQWDAEVQTADMAEAHQGVVFVQRHDWA